jgi:hypothetical protein
MTELKMEASKVIRLTPREMDRALELSRERTWELEAAVRDLLATLPACDNHPDRPATQLGGTCDRCWDDCDPAGDLPYAPAIRRLVALVGRLEAGE